MDDKEKVIRECNLCKQSFWIWKNENEPNQKYICHNCKLLEVKIKW